MIERFVDFEVLEAQFEKYGIVEANLLGAMHDIKYTFLPRMSRRVHIWQLLESLDEIENGFQIFYRCLSETHAYHDHDMALTYLKIEGKSEL